MWSATLISINQMGPIGTLIQYLRSAWDIPYCYSTSGTSLALSYFSKLSPSWRILKAVHNAAKVSNHFQSACFYDPLSFNVSEDVLLDFDFHTVLKSNDPSVLSQKDKHPVKLCPSEVDYGQKLS